eukprot:TRINITY_DN5331_c0_g1_i3.p1 TRINITY_DN5331_c0_g1~~TRINITY_DN5331_c0_g1_i3.p1  ORF type:complete len:845 (-),score=169.37 TRINITY_DN5331_c0_g1_i3:2211-4745(-)
MVRVSKGYWSDINNQRNFLLSLAKVLKLKKTSELTSLTSTVLKKHGGAGLLNHYEGSLIRCLRTAFPSEKWNPLDFSHVPSNYWSDIEHQRTFLNKLAETLKLSSRSDWAFVTAAAVQKNGGSGLLDFYGGSLLRCLQAVFPNENWKQKKLPNNYWDDLNRQLEHLEDYAKKNDISDWFLWTAVSKADFLRKGGSQQLIAKHGSLLQVLRAVYPNRNWSEARNIVWRQNLENFAEKHNIKRIEDWSRISVNTFKTEIAKGRQILRVYSSVYGALKALYSDRDWHALPVRQAHHTSKPQQLIFRFLTEEKMVGTMNCRISSLPTIGTELPSKSRLELDMFFPSEKLAVEFQGQVHFSQLFKQQSMRIRQQNDELKRLACRDAGITLVAIPYWWDRSKDQLIATVRQQRPDLLFEAKINQNAIPLSQISPRMDQSVLMSAGDWKSTVDPAGRMITEKMDGVRAYWNGSQLYSRSGGLIIAPSDFKRNLPAGVPLDGELWCGRQSFLTTLAVVRSWEQTDWSSIAFYPFDVPERNVPFPRRLEILRSLVKNANLCPVDVSNCTGQEDLLIRLVDLVCKGGEGLMLRDPNGFYESGRSNSVLKVKPKFLDVVVVKKTDVGQRFLVQNSLGAKFKLNRGVSKDRFPGVSVGSVITIKFTGVYPFGSPRFPNIVSHHSDLKFSDVIHYSLSTNFGPAALRFDKEATCRGCQRTLQNDEHRVQVNGFLWSKGVEEPQRKIFSFCANLDCVRRGSEADQVSAMVRYPKFSERIGLAFDLEPPFSLKRRDAVMLSKYSRGKKSWEKMESELRKIADRPSVKNAMDNLRSQGVEVELSSEKVLVNNHFCFVVDE